MTGEGVSPPHLPGDQFRWPTGSPGHSNRRGRQGRATSEWSGPRSRQSGHWSLSIRAQEAPWVSERAEMAAIGLSQQVDEAEAA